ncbi:MAG: phosphatidylethanolamine N-methyltransferase family protein, partial [Pirellulales bacterium]|nr:phosphatidylethanolamine N-methyltransferase family protein [Pirellulales bacterium]
YRCMVAASPNAEVTTHFPMVGTNYDRPEGHRLETGDAIAFDFNRELHYITRQLTDQQTEPRVNLKLHFVAFPASMAWYGNWLAKLTTAYDVRARQLFLQTIAPHSWWPKLKTRWVLGWTKVFELVVRFLGWNNLAYVSLMAIVSLILGEAFWLIVSTSFVHYAIYVGTLRERGKVAFGAFRRDAIFFKTLALAQLFGCYAVCFSGQWLSLSLVGCGFALAGWATMVLGLSRTYFSSELGFEPPRRIKRFPYGLIPHPMILGAMMGIAAMLFVPEFRTSYGWLAAAHLVCYAIVLGQEIFHETGRNPIVEPETAEKTEASVHTA